MKILFHTNTAIKDSPHYHYTFNYSPTGIKYIYKMKEADAILDMKVQAWYKILSTAARAVAHFTGQSIPNISIVSNVPVKYDLIHSFNTIPNTKLPYVLELESFHSLFIGPLKGMTVEIIKRRLRAKNCKKILFWTCNAQANFLKIMDNDKIIKSKSQVLYPAVPLYIKNKYHKKPTIGFIARNFENKGGEFILPIMKSLVKSGRAKAIVVTYLNELNKPKINPYKKYIDFIDLLPRELLHKNIFPKIDVLFYPGYSDTFGYLMPESMSHGIPIVTFDGVARKEIVHPSLGGHVLPADLNQYGYLDGRPDLKYPDDYENWALMAITNALDKNTWEKMSEYNYNLVKSGIFSLYNRNKCLKKIYNEALK